MPWAVNSPTVLSCNAHISPEGPQVKEQPEKHYYSKKVPFSFFGACHKGGIHELHTWPDLKTKQKTPVFISFDCLSSERLVVDPYWKWHIGKMRVAEAAWCCTDREKNFGRLLGWQIVQKTFQETRKIPFCGSSLPLPFVNAQRQEGNDVQSKPKCESKLSHKHGQFQFLAISDSYLL